MRGDVGVDLGPSHRVAPAEERDSGADHALGKVASRRDPQTGVLKPGAPPLFGPEALVRQLLIDKTLRDLRSTARLPLFDGDRDREVRYTVEEVGRPIERVDDPA